jgi:hypothetical protein
MRDCTNIVQALGLRPEASQSISTSFVLDLNSAVSS